MYVNVARNTTKVVQTNVTARSFTQRYSTIVNGCIVTICGITDRTDRIFTFVRGCIDPLRKSVYSKPVEGERKVLKFEPD